MRPSARLRARLDQERILILPGAADALTARVIENTGHEALYATGAGIANTSLGMPDLGLLTMSEIVTQVQHIADAVDIPVIVDADTGYGGPLNVIRAIREFERSGIAGVQIEDQVSPKRCGHFDGQEVIPIREMVGKIEAIRYARQDPDLLLIARTDSRSSEGFDAAVERAQAYAAAGADVVFVEAPATIEELRELPKRVSVPLLVNMVEGGKTPLLNASELEAMGYRIALFANTSLRVAMKAVGDAMRELLSEGTTKSLEDRMLSWDERQELVRLSEYLELGSRFEENTELAPNENEDYNAEAN